MLTRVGALREGISAGRAAAERVTVDGYRIEPGLKAFDDAETVPVSYTHLDVYKRQIHAGLFTTPHMREHIGN